MENTRQSDLQSKEEERQQHQRSLQQEYHRGKEAGTFCAAAPSRACHLLRDKGCVRPLSRVMCCAASQATSCMRTIALGVLLLRLLGLAASTEFPDACFAGQNDERARNAAAKAGCCCSDLALLLPRASSMQSHRILHERLPHAPAQLFHSRRNSTSRTMRTCNGWRSNEPMPSRFPR